MGADVTASQSSWTDGTSAGSEGRVCPCRPSAGEGSSSSSSAAVVGETSGPLQGTPFKPGSITTKGKACCKLWAPRSDKHRLLLLEQKISAKFNQTGYAGVYFKPEIHCGALILAACQETTTNFNSSVCVCGKQIHPSI